MCAYVLKTTIAGYANRKRLVGTDVAYMVKGAKSISLTQMVL